MVWPWTLTFWPKNEIRSSVSQDAPVTKVWRKSVNRYWRYRGNIKLPRESRTDGRMHGQRHGRTTRKHIASAGAYRRWRLKNNFSTLAIPRDTTVTNLHKSINHSSLATQEILVQNVDRPAAGPASALVSDAGCSTYQCWSGPSLGQTYEAPRCQLSVYIPANTMSVIQLSQLPSGNARYGKYHDIFENNENIGYFQYFSIYIRYFRYFHFTALDWVMSTERLVFKLYISEWGYPVLRIITIAIPCFALRASCGKKCFKIT